MEKTFMLFTGVFFLILITGVAPVWAKTETPADNMDLKQEMAVLKDKVACLEKMGQNNNEDGNPLESALSGMGIAGGISAGSFYASNPGQDMSDNEFLLSNFLVELSSSTDKRIAFVGAFGQTSTPSLLGIPENNKNFDIEYASLTLNPFADIHLEAGLLQPNAGYECTYTYNNKNIISGALASQQPYNAYGARLNYAVDTFLLYGGYFKQRLDDEEYEENETIPDDSWEIGLGREVADMEFNIYHYHLVGMRNLTGAFIMWTSENFDVGADIDYWHWDSTLKNDSGRKYSIGGAVYLCPRFDKFSIPVRLEYIDQGKSMIYIDSMKAKRIYTATISPTYNFSKKSYIRCESCYVDADSAFFDKNGNSENNRLCLAAEVGYLF